MDLPIDAEVKCAGRTCGHISNIILNPVTETVTHIVVRRNQAPHTEYVVPVEEIEEGSVNCVQLLCSLTRLEEMEHYVETEYLRVQIPEYVNAAYRALPFVLPETKDVVSEHEQIPAGELSVHRGARVNALDGHVGQVDEFLIDPASGHITHLILREGHLWGKKDVVIPLSMIDRIAKGEVYLKAKKSALGKLPEIPVNRRWQCEDVQTSGEVSQS
jgi:sporulation protein YlmC with PRC-barrel domain